MRRSDTSASTGATSTGATSGSEPTATIGGACLRPPSIGSRLSGHVYRFKGLTVQRTDGTVRGGAHLGKRTDGSPTESEDGESDDPAGHAENMQNGFLIERSRKSLPCVRQQSSFNKALFNWHFFLSDASTPWIFAPPAVARLVVAESTFRPSLRPRASSNSPTEIRAGSRRWDKQSQLHLPELFLHSSRLEVFRSWASAEPVEDSSPDGFW